MLRFELPLTAEGVKAVFTSYRNDPECLRPWSQRTLEQYAGSTPRRLERLGLLASICDPERIDKVSQSLHESPETVKQSAKALAAFCSILNDEEKALLLRDAWEREVIPAKDARDLDEEGLGRWFDAHVTKAYSTQDRKWRDLITDSATGSPNRPTERQRRTYRSMDDVEEQWNARKRGVMQDIIDAGDRGDAGCRKLHNAQFWVALIMFIQGSIALRRDIGRVATREEYALPDEPYLVREDRCIVVPRANKVSKLGKKVRKEIRFDECSEAWQYLEKLFLTRDKLNQKWLFCGIRKSEREQKRYLDASFAHEFAKVIGASFPDNGGPFNVSDLRRAIGTRDMLDGPQAYQLHEWNLRAARLGHSLQVAVGPHYNQPSLEAQASERRARLVAVNSS